MRNIWLVALALLPASCGKLEDKFGRLSGDSTSVRFKVEENALATTPLTGIMVYAVRADNANSRGAKYVNIQGVATGDWTIPNGVYHFYAFGYSAAGMSGTMYCGKSESRALSGGTQTVNLGLLDLDACGLPPFSPTGYGASGDDAPKPLYLGFCASTGGDISGATDVQACNGSGSPATPASSSAVNSVNITFSEYTRWQPGVPPVIGANSLSTGCLNGAFLGSAPATTSRALPFGPAFVVTLESYSAASCSGFLGSYTFSSGLINAAVNSLAIFRNTANTQITTATQMAKPADGTGTVKLYLRVY